LLLLLLPLLLLLLLLLLHSPYFASLKQWSDVLEKQTDPAHPPRSSLYVF
jgi:hypothetical protein